jgi:hypothetical protein
MNPPEPDDQDPVERLIRDTHVAGIGAVRERMRDLNPTNNELAGTVMGHLMAACPWEVLDALDKLAERRTWNEVREDLSPLLREMKD